MPIVAPVRGAVVVPVRWIRSTALAGAALAALSALGCGGDAGLPTRDEFAGRLVERHGITSPEARCAADMVFAEYNDDGIRALYDEGLTGVPHPYWSKFAYSMVQCGLADELAEEDGT